MLQDFIDQVIDNVPVVAGKGGDEPVHVGLALHGEGGQLQPGNPAFGAPRQRGQFYGGEV